MDQPNRQTATWIGIIALASWAALAFLTTLGRGIPPFEMLALNAAVAFALGCLYLARRGRKGFAVLRQPVQAWLLAAGAIFAYHALYFYALASVPPARASLICFFWPLLIVVFAALANRRLQAAHLIGALLGLLGVFLIFADGARGAEPTGAVSGYFAAAACAVIWAAYSVANRRYAGVPSEMLIGVAGLVALASGLCHFAFETTVLPDLRQGIAILLLGIFPLGVGFLAWDHATKYGNLPLLGALSYLTPLVSTLVLIASGQTTATLGLGLAALAIVAGAAIAARPPARPAALRA
ncbi:DMT family transporter [Paracoccus aminophilus]|uniref:EamA domain-containing protein n=1 Tax=Paracoccus aminophilus JCM 7686 TaxID=1367847 RepID=S5YWS7_PARAH|nr:DMT family transporter [Paracoccus aminophilus]AGT09661.1 hypothetical protein JCM7686_2593 [Paracoccus aminophilus JCM 7686]